MKTTIELPDDLFRRVKLHAVQSDSKLKDMVAQLLEAGLRAAQPAAPAELPKPVRRRRGGPFTAEAIEAAIASGRE